MSDFTQVKVSVSAEIATAFKAKCVADGVSMTAVLAQCMAEYSKRSTKKVTHEPDYSTRRKRRAAVKVIMEQLECIRDAEEQAKENIPENLQGHTVYETSDESVSSLTESLESLGSAY